MYYNNHSQEGRIVFDWQLGTVVNLSGWCVLCSFKPQIIVNIEGMCFLSLVYANKPFS